MSGYIITEDFIEWKRLYEEGNIGKFENKISSYTADDLREFAAYFSLDISSKNEYYNLKIISEITYNLILKEKFTKNDRFIILALKHRGRCVYISYEKGLWRDVIKYGNLIYEYTLDNDEKWDIQDYLSQAYFYQGNIITRNGVSESASYTLKEVWAIHKKMIIVLQDNDIGQMLLEKLANREP